MCVRERGNDCETAHSAHRPKCVSVCVSVLASSLKSGIEENERKKEKEKRDLF